MSKKRKCLHCKEYSLMDEMLKCNAGWFCSIEHMQEYGSKKSAKIKVKQEKKSHSAAKRKLKDEDRSFQLKKTQQLFNGYIRSRDSGSPCISCSQFHSGQYHAGHYRSVGSSPELRFDERNCYKQCAPCNNHLSGNLIQYRRNLITLAGEELVHFLEGPHKPKRYTIENLKTIQKWFKRKTKRMEKDHV